MKQIANEFTNEKISSLEWFRKGEEFADWCISSQKKTHNGKGYEQSMSVEGAVCFVLGEAYKITKSYSENMQAHFKNLEKAGSFPILFSAKRRKELRSLNMLGFAEEVLFNIADFFKEEKKVEAYVIDSIIGKIDDGLPGYGYISVYSDRARENIRNIRKEILLGYAGFDIENADAKMPLVPDNRLAPALNYIRNKLNKSDELRKDMNYASKFLETNIFAPFQKYIELHEEEIAAEDVKRCKEVLNSMLTLNGHTSNYRSKL